MNIWQIILLVCFGIMFVMNWIVQTYLDRFIVVALVIVGLMFCVVMA